MEKGPLYCEGIEAAVRRLAMPTNNDIPDWRITGLVGPMQLRYRLPMQFRVGPYVRIWSC
jgi:hypothetical protein